MHTHILGGSGFGKSKLIEHMCREQYLKGNSFAVFDWHGTLYRELISYFAYMNPRRPVVLLDPSQGFFVAGFNPFAECQMEPTVQVNRRIAATLKPWGGNVNDMPTFESTMRLVYTFAVEHRVTLPVAALLLRRDAQGAQLRKWAEEHSRDSHIRARWAFLNELKTAHDWEGRVLSAQNRLDRFLGSRSIARHFGSQTAVVDVPKVMERGAIMLVNLSDSEFLDRDSARVFAALLLNEFFEAAMRRAGTRKTYTLYLDEFQEYATSDIPAILTQGRKGGLGLVLAHQNLGQLSDPSLYSSVKAVHTKVIFGGTSTDDAFTMARETMLPEINQRRVKKPLYAFTTSHELRTFVDEQMTRTTSESEAVRLGAVMFDGEDWVSADDVTGYGRSSATTVGIRTSRMLIPTVRKEQIGEEDYTLEEKASFAAERLKYQDPRHAMVQMGNRPPVFWRVPDVNPVRLSPRFVQDYEAKLFERQSAISPQLADREIELQQQELLARIAPPKRLPPETFNEPVTSKRRVPAKRSN